METVAGFETPEEAALELELPLLGTLPPPEIEEGVAIAPAFPADERARREYHRAADRLLLSPHSRAGSIGLLGDVSPGHRALVAARLAASVASERTAILVDADVRAARLSFDERDRAQEGLVDVLRYGVRSPRVVAPTQTPGLNLLPVGSGTVDLEGTFGSEAVRALFDELGRSGDLLLINGPDLRDFREAASFLAEVDAWILVHEIGVSDSGKTRRLRDTFGRDKCVGILAVAAPEPAVAAEPAADESAAPAAAVSTEALEIVHGADSGVSTEMELPPAASLPEPAEPLSMAPPPMPPVPEVSPAELEAAMAQAEAEAVEELELAEPSDFLVPEEAAAPAEAAIPEEAPPAEAEEMTEPPAFEAPAPAEPEAEEPPASAEEPGPRAHGLLGDVEAPTPAVAVPDAYAPGAGFDPAPEPAAEPVPAGASAEHLESGVEASGGGGGRRPWWIAGAVVVLAVAAFFAWRIFGGTIPGGGAEPQVAEAPRASAPRATPAAGTSEPSSPAGAGAGVSAPAAGAEGAADGAQPGPSSPEGATDNAAGPDVPQAAEPGAAAGSPAPPAATEPPARVEPPVEKNPPVERTAPVGTTGPRYGVHVASIKAEAGARREAARFEAAGYPVVLVQKEIPGKGLWWRVYVGPYGTKGDAGQMAGELKKAGITDYTQVHRLPEE